MVDPVFDKCGENTPMMKVDETACAAIVYVHFSPMFLDWMVQFGGRMQVISPANVVGEYKKHIEQIQAK